MILDVHRKKVRKYFLWEKYIREGIEEEKARIKAMRDLRHSKTLLGYNDPTGELFVRRNTKLKKCRFTLPGGQVHWLKKPEDWIEIMEQVYEIYGTQPLTKVLRERAKNNKMSPVILANLKGMDRNSYYRMEKEFLDDAIFLAAERGLFKKN